MSKRILILLLIISIAVFTFCTKKSTTPEEKLLPPTDLTITLVENNQIQINWTDTSTNETAFLIDRKKGAYEWLVNYSDVTANLTSFTDNVSTNSDTVYAYRIRAFDGEDFSAYSDTIAWFSVNSAPTNLEIEQIAQDTLQLTWQDNSIGEQYFRIDRKIDEKGWQTNYTHVPADSTHFLDYTTALYDTCNYKVFAVNGISHSDSTENAFIPFLPAPSDLQIEAITAIAVKLTFLDNCHNEEGYRLYAKRGETAVWDSFDVQGYLSPIVTIVDGNVIPGIINYYKICAYYENETSGFIEDEINTLPAPSNLTCTQQDVHTFELTWNDNSAYEQGFKIDRKIDDGEWTSPLEITQPNAITWIDSTIGRNFETVYYRLYAYYETYSSDSIETNSNIAFPAPKDLEYEKLTIHSIKLTWDDYSQGETGFIIDKKIGVGIGEWQIEYAIVGENIQEWTDDAAEINETLQYRIHAYCGDNVSDYATSQEIDNTFPAPTDISYQKIDIATIKLNWTDNSVGERGFKIDKKVGDGDWEIEYAVLDADIVQWFDWTAEINEMIQYRVYAYYGGDVSDYAFTDEIDNTIPAPSNLEYEILSPTSVKLTWEDNSIGEDGFKIDKKVGDGAWQIVYAVLGDNVTDWVDENDLFNDIVTYRIYTYYQNFNSEFVYIDIPNFYIHEDFSDGIANNFVFEDGRWYIADSNLIMEGWQNDSWANAYYNQEFKNYTIETRVRRIESNETLGYTFGLFIRSNGFLGYDSKSADGYLIAVSATGEYSVWLEEGGVETMIIDWTETANIGYGLYAFTKIKVVANGSDFDLYFNDVLTDGFNDSTFQIGYIGLVSYDSSEGDNEIWWQYFDISPPESTKETLKFKKLQPHQSKNSATHSPKKLNK
jgi:hypothetical protein